MTVPRKPPRQQASTTDPTPQAPCPVVIPLPNPHEDPLPPGTSALARGTAGPQVRPDADQARRRTRLSPHMPAATTARTPLEVSQ